ncbi:MAG: tRNA (adenosine(37)-N6)-threonylcarbamoyltransferase complex ATPase subunit type 1 TsaE [Bdellovibrionota bacterium]
MTKIFLPNSEATEQFGRKISPHIRLGDIVKITGPLGAGKTTLVRGIVAGLGGDPSQVHSPTFSLVHEYDSPSGVINHCDFYRLRSQSELEEFGGAEFFEEDKIFFIEWPEQVRLPDLPISRRWFDVKITLEGDGRSIELPPSWEIVD